jgi:hypothetical protein
VTPLLFAVVDMVLWAAMYEAQMHWRQLLSRNGSGWETANAGLYARQMEQHLGWWRSCWPVGGGA